VSADNSVPVVCAIIERGSAVFAARRKPPATNGGLWEFPGGKVHPGETRGDALVREIVEELGVTILPLRELAPVRWTYPWITIDLFPFVCSIAEDATPLPLDHAEIGFFDGAALAQLTWAPADRVIVDRYLTNASMKNG
jgi:8-oxo-dGTP diphosphatase